MVKSMCLVNFDSDFRQVDSSHPLCLNLKGVCIIWDFQRLYGNSTISLLINGESVGMYAYEQYQNGCGIYKSCIPMPAVPPSICLQG